MIDNQLTTTHIRITKEVKRQLEELGKKNETYDQVLRRLLKLQCPPK